MRIHRKQLVKKVGDYGIDAPSAVRGLILGAAGCILASGILYGALGSGRSWTAFGLVISGLAAGAGMLVTAGLLVWSSKIGKLRLRDKLAASLVLGGSEIVLDVGCGRGLLLNGVARRLTTGKAIGVDLWRSEDLSGNSPETTRANAAIEGLADRVEVRTGDMRELPFQDGAVDVLVSSLAIHNIPDREGRAQAVREIARVLKPNGQVALLDLRYTTEYAKTLGELGWREVRISGLRFEMFPPVRIVAGKKNG